jgi:hypothetical protein
MRLWLTALLGLSFQQAAVGETAVRVMVRLVWVAACRTEETKEKEDEGNTKTARTSMGSAGISATCS